METTAMFKPTKGTVSQKPLLLIDLILYLTKKSDEPDVTSPHPMLYTRIYYCAYM